MDETFDTIIKTTATINLLAKRYLGDYLFTANDRKTKVTITKAVSGKTESVFVGYIQPFTYNQDFAEEFTEIELNCIDYLSTLENHRYHETSEYEAVKNNADTVPFRNILLDLLDSDENTILYDGSILSSSSGSSLLEDMGTNELLFCGDEEDDWWTEEDVITEILQFLNLHAIQEGNVIKLFNWASVKKTGSITWYNLSDGEQVTATTQLNTVDASYYKSDDTNITISDVYNKWTVKCDLQEVENLFVSPLDSDSLTSPFGYKYKCLKEVIDINAGKTKDWYFQYLTNGTWNFRYYENAQVKNVWDLIQSECVKSTEGKAIYGNQYNLLKKAGGLKFFPLLCEFGGVDGSSFDDTSVKGTVSMTPTLVIMMNGSCNKDYNSTNEYNLAIDKFEAAGGMIEYKSNASAGVLTPSDSNTINYIVFSGKFSLQPRPADWLVQYYTDENWPKDTNKKADSTKIMLPYLGHEGWRSQFREYYGDWLFYNSTGVDKVDKIGVIICELKIGDKYACEYEENKFLWLTKEEANVKGIETTFSLGFNPAVGDYFLCKQWEISNTLRVEQNLDTEGTAIPITYDDKVSGKVEFRILGISNIRWGQLIRKHPTFFRSTKYWTTDIDNIMEFVEAIYITDFECKVYSNNGNYSSDYNNNKDLIYMSNVKTDSIKEKDDITFKINTALSTSESMEKGLSTSVKLSNVVDIPNKLLSFLFIIRLTETVARVRKCSLTIISMSIQNQKW